ncbi:peptidase S8/S53 domain-containing protein [Phakopsora pachyrhizi]|uniref:Peptidase S8/S53 domain-containing protein n=1 Tax=Phakopsora pachyrhizi TaxID=170000 RepID=A0AAV0AHY6_PHAPC|nr:peptidase S8/S53 domain-containing protein [Phakopsora pachyrhizi]KAI8454677.1 peptidase S8/S53 domain-containing protein [Phakopsora pachyrhizi]CAH7666967.1 peptidase S8/S53 domain-containing protein [Phakopsora pachyrhizi]
MLELRCCLIIIIICTSIANCSTVSVRNSVLARRQDDLFNFPKSEPLSDSLTGIDDFVTERLPKAVLPKRYLVSLDPAITPSVEAFQQHLDSLNVPHRVVLDLTSIVPDVFYGVSVELDRDEDSALLEQSTQILKFNPVMKVTPIDTLARKIVDPSVEQVDGAYPPHVQANITELHQMGIYGEGVKVALIDSGIDCKHPALGNGFGEGFKIGFGRDFVPNSKAKDPCTPCATHGTHVAGIVAANDVGFGFTGVAPNATLGMYLFGCGDHTDTSNDVILAAILQAHKDGADIISASLGGSGGWGTGEVILDAVNKLVKKKGAIVLFAAGNEGSEGLFNGASPASSENSISIGSVDSSAMVAGTFVASTSKNLTYFATSRFSEGQTFPVFMTPNSDTTEEDACKPFPADTPDLSKYMVVIKRGTCLFSEKVKNAKAKGAKRILFYMNSTSTITLSNSISNVTIAVTANVDGDYIFQEHKKDPENFKLSFPKTRHYYSPSQEGGFMSNFSQYGPSFDMLSPQPAVSGVGGNVISTYPVAEGSYASLSGTSMATPQLAGIVALVLSVRGKNFTGEMIRNRLSSSTKILAASNSDPQIQSVVHQGGGLINAYCAVLKNTTLSTSDLSLGDSKSFKTEHEFTIINEGGSTVNYNTRHISASTVTTFPAHSSTHRPSEKVTLTPEKLVEAAISPESFSLEPGSAQVIKVIFTEPEENSDTLPVYSGFINLVSDLECEEHNLPYFGVAGSLKAQPILDQGKNKNKTASYPYLSLKKNPKTEKKDIIINSESESPFLWDLNKHNSTLLRYRTLFGTPLVRVDVFNGNETQSSNENDNSNWERSFKGIPLIGMVPDSNSTHVSRSAADDEFLENWNGTIVTSKVKKPTLLPSGNYKLLLRALRVTGEKTRDDDYDFWISPAIQLQRRGEELKGSV